MDELIRGYIKSAMDEMIVEKGDLRGVLEPFLEALQIKSFKEFALGYMIGGAKVLATSLITVKEISTGKMRRLSNRDKLEIVEMIMENLSKIEERIERELNR